MELLSTVQAVQRRFLTLLESGDGDMNELSPGQMLLMGFNGLFTRLDDEFNTVLACVDSMSVPGVWKKVDVIRDAKSLQVGQKVKSSIVYAQALTHIVLMGNNVIFKENI